MTGAEVIDEVYQRLPVFWRTKIGRARVKMIIHLLYEVIIEATASGESVRIREFARFEARERKSQRVYCPIIGEHRKAKEHLRVVTTSAKKWRRALQVAANKE
jgi:nucleoid DNA-binding protein